MICLQVEFNASVNQINLCCRACIKISVDTYLARIFPGFYHGHVYKSQVTVPETKSQHESILYFYTLLVKIAYNTTLPVKICRVSADRATFRAIFSSRRVC